MTTIDFVSTGRRFYGANIYNVLLDGEIVATLRKDQLPETALSPVRRFWVLLPLDIGGTLPEALAATRQEWDTAREARAAIRAAVETDAEGLAMRKRFYDDRTVDSDE